MVFVGWVDDWLVGWLLGVCELGNREGRARDLEGGIFLLVVRERVLFW